MSEISHNLTEEELGDLAVSDSTAYESQALESDTAIIPQVSGVKLGIFTSLMFHFWSC